MAYVYLCLTCLRLKPKEGQCHNRPLIRCAPDWPDTVQLGLHPHAPHWLLQTLREMQQPNGDEADLTQG